MNDLYSSKANGESHTKSSSVNSEAITETSLGMKKSPSSPSGLRDCSETQPSDFLSKIDSSIALMKSSIEKMETSS